MFFVSKWLSENKKNFWVQAVLSADQIHTLSEKIHLAHQHKIKNLIFSNYNPNYSGQENKVIYDNNLEFAQAGQDAHKLAKSLRINLTLPQPIQKIPLKRSCQMPFSYVHLDSKGTMGACCFRAPNKKYGTIFETNDWNLPAHQELRNTFLKPETEPLKECRNCENFNRDLYGL